MDERLINNNSKQKEEEEEDIKEQISTVDYLKQSHLIHYLIYIGILATLSATILCSIYIILIYQDVHNTYTQLNSSSDIMKNVNMSHIIELINQMSAFEDCFTSKFCDRKHEF
jgi:hypothetical protein